MFKYRKNLLCFFIVVNLASFSWAHILCVVTWKLDIKVGFQGCVVLGNNLISWVFFMIPFFIFKVKEHKQSRTLSCAFLLFSFPFSSDNKIFQHTPWTHWSEEDGYLKDTNIKARSFGFKTCAACVRQVLPPSYIGSLSWTLESILRIR